MTIRRYSVNKLPGEPGFVDELNSVLSELASLANSVLRIELLTVSRPSGASVAIEHHLGVIPDLVWGWREVAPLSANRPITVSAAEQQTWDARTIRFTPTAHGQVYLVVIALT